MMRRNHKQPGLLGKKKRNDAHAWLGAEIELIIRERERLLAAAGAAAALFTALDPARIPREARASVQRLAAVLGSLPEETLIDAIEMSLGQRGKRNLVPAAH
ncbi:MAG: hypothetical protein EHM59_03135 [Betaproteobacteria bacterium]|nr:MAG: hypothetical protein EHM59_03135 [Betaproteobacteria bacterium]